MRTLSFGLWLFVIGCQSYPAFDPFGISPADGRSDVGAFQPLVLLRTDLSFAPIPPLIRVVDLEVGGYVPGLMEVLPEGVAFIPDEPWPRDRYFAWTVEEPLDPPRQPTVDIDGFGDTFVFNTYNRPEVLGVAYDGPDGICIVASQPLLLADLQRFEITTSTGISLTPIDTRIPEPNRLDVLDLPEEDAGLGTACLTFGQPVDPSMQLRFTADGHSSLHPVRELSVTQIALLLHKTQP